MPLNIKDAELTKSFALPNGAATTNSAGIDLATSNRGDFVADCELVVNAPACTTGQLGDTQTLTYSVRHDDNADFSTDSELMPAVVVQTGAGGAGAVAAEKRLRLPLNVKRYVRVRCVKTGASNASTASCEMSIRT